MGIAKSWRSVLGPYKWLYINPPVFNIPIGPSRDYIWAPVELRFGDNGIYIYAKF